MGSGVGSALTCSGRENNANRELPKRGISQYPVELAKARQAYSFHLGAALSSNCMPLQSPEAAGFCIAVFTISGLHFCVPVLID